MGRRARPFAASNPSPHPCTHVPRRTAPQGSLPYAKIRDAGAIVNLVLAGQRPSPLDGIDEGIVAIVQRCWKQDPQARPTFLEAEDAFAALLHKNRRNWPAQRDIGVTLSKSHLKRNRKQKRQSIL